MPIPVTCPSCATTLKAPDSAAGRKVKCPKCGNPFAVPAPGEEPPAMVSAAPPAPRRAAPPPPEEDFGDDEPMPRGRRPRDDGYSPGPAGAGTGLPMGLGIASLALGASALVVAWIPCIGYFSWPISAIGLILGIVGLIIALTRQGRGMAFPIAGAGTSLVALGLALYWVFWWHRATSDVNDFVNQVRAQQQKQHDLFNQQIKDKFKAALNNPGNAAQIPPVGAVNMVGAQGSVNAALADADPVDPLRPVAPGNPGAPCKVYTINLAGGKTYQIDLSSKQFDAYLRMLNPEGMQVAFNDDFGGTRDSRIMYTCPQAGQYRIMVTCLWPTFGPYGRTGDFTLVVNEK